jgi:hypothetical protein
MAMRSDAEIEGAAESLPSIEDRAIQPPSRSIVRHFNTTTKFVQFGSDKRREGSSASIGRLPAVMAALNREGAPVSQDTHKW